MAVIKKNLTSFRCEKYRIVCRIFPACPLAENDLAPRRVLLQRYADQGATLSDCIWTVAPSFAARTDAVYVSTVLGRVGVVKCDHKGDDRPLLTLLEECVRDCACAERSWLWSESHSPGTLHQLRITIPLPAFLTNQSKAQ